MYWFAASAILSSVILQIPSGLEVRGASAPSVTTLSKPAVLHGLTAVKVVVEDLAPDVKPLGLTKEGLRAAVEERLKAKGVRVMPSSDAKLYMRVTTVEN